MTLIIFSPSRNSAQEAMQVDEDDRPELEWWKCKKWALHILERFIYRYGNPANAEKEYQRFAQYYARTFNGEWTFSGTCVL